MNTPIIITVSREQIPLIFQHLASERGSPQSGDYSIRGLAHAFAVVRISIADLCQWFALKSAGAQGVAEPDWAAVYNDLRKA